MSAKMMSLLLASILAGCCLTEAYVSGPLYIHVKQKKDNSRSSVENAERNEPNYKTPTWEQSERHFYETASERDLRGNDEFSSQHRDFGYFEYPSRQHYYARDSSEYPAYSNDGKPLWD